MGTFYSITVIQGGGKVLSDEAFGELKSSVDSLLEEINRQMSTYDPDSEISRFNRLDDTSAFVISPEFMRVIIEAQRISELSGGAFDITVGPLVGLWGFGPEEPEAGYPDSAKIAAARETIGYRHLVVVDDAHIRKTIPALRLDLNAIAKGYGVDAVAELLERRGIDEYLVDIGGELAAAGNNVDGTAWKVGIQKPVPESLPGAELQQVLELSNVAIATSGDYRNYIEIDGRKFSHEIDPATGYPVTHTLASVTVIAPTCMEADGLATAFIVMGTEKAKALAERLDGIEALFYERQEDGSYREILTSGAEKYIPAGE